MDTYGSRSLVVGGIALYNGLRRRCVEKAKPVAAHMLECRPGRPGVHRRARSGCGARPDGGKTHRRTCALAVFAAHDLPDGIEPTLDADATFDPVNFSFPHGTHLCAVEVDTETGQVDDPVATSAVDDVGKVINPLIVEGQVHGGVAQGIAQALFEEAVYDDERQPAHRHVRRLPGAERGRPAATSSPTAPRRRRPTTRWASRASARPARSPSTPAVVNAIVDALRPFGVNDVADAVHARAGVAGHPRRVAGRCRSDPGAVRLRASVHCGRGGRARSAEAGEDAKVLAGGQSLLPLLRLRLAAPERRWSTSAASPSCAASATTATRSSSAR